MFKTFNIKIIIKTNTFNCFVDLFLFHTLFHPSEFVGLTRPLCCVLEKSFTLTVALHPGAVTCSALVCLPTCAALGSLLCSQCTHCGFLKAFARSALCRAFLVCSHGYFLVHSPKYSPGVPLLSPVDFYTHARVFLNGLLRGFPIAFTMHLLWVSPGVCSPFTLCVSHPFPCVILHFCALSCFPRAFPFVKYFKELWFPQGFPVGLLRPPCIRCACIPR